MRHDEWVGCEATRATVIDAHGDRPVKLITEMVRLDDELFEVVKPVPIAGVGKDGKYHPGPLVNPAVIRRAMMLTNNAELRRMGVATYREQD